MNPSWLDAPELWDTVTLADVTLPGLCRISGGDLGYREDIIEPDGGNYRVNRLNYRPAEVEVTVVMWLDAQWQDYARIVRRFKPQKDLDSPPLEVIHPALEPFEIQELYIVDMSLPRKTDEGFYEAVIKLREFWEEREALPKATQVTPVAGPSLALDEIDLAAAFPLAPSDSEVNP